MNVTFQLRYCDAPQRPAAAWLLHGSSSAEWLAELIGWGVPLVEAKLLEVPGAGLLAWLPPAQSPPRHAAQAYGRISERLYLPVEAALDPPLSDRELAGLLPAGESLLLWHPRLGLLQFASQAVLRVTNLLTPPARNERLWNAAQPGLALNYRLLSIEPTQRPTLEGLIEAARGDIGTRPLAGGRLPTHPGEPLGGAIGQAATQAGLAAAGAAAGAIGAMAAAAGAALQGLAGMAGGGAAGAAPQRQPAGQPAQTATGNWLQRLADWARQQQEAAAGQLDRLRHRQVERLLHLLRDSPDQGLKFAIPFTGGGEHRGLARPGASLVERNVDFSLSRLGGGGAADFWDLPNAYRRQLAEQYRALANREIALGRHRRAAYIFAELLSDLTTAASTLAAGGHHREAAVLYEQRLHQPLAAARCLAQGGLWAEAIAIYERLNQWETVGELYVKLDQPESAEQAYRKAVTLKLSTNDHLGAAELVETKLHAPLEAQEILWSGWDAGAQNRRCLEASFALLARHQLHNEARRQVGELGPGKVRSDRAVAAAAVLAQAARQYPAQEICVLAADTTRGLVSDRLPQVALNESQELLAALAALIPADKLLARDCDRYQAERAAEQAERRLLAVGSRLRPRPTLRLVRTFRLPPGDWRAAATSGDTFYAAGWLRGRLAVVRGRWDGTIQLQTIEAQPAQSRRILLAADPRGLGTLYVQAGEVLTGAPLKFPSSDQLPHALAVSPHAGCEAVTRVLTYGPGGTVLVGRLALEGGDLALVLTPYEGERPLPGVQAVRITLDDLPDQDYVEQEPLPFYSRAADYYLGIGRLLVHKRLRQTSCLAPSPILSITGSAPHARPRIVLGCEQGGMVLWGDTADVERTTFAADLAEPAVGINRGGWLIAATGETVEVFSTTGGQLHFVASTDGPRTDPLAVLATDDNRRFAIVTEEGGVLVYEVP